MADTSAGKRTEFVLDEIDNVEHLRAVITQIEDDIETDPHGPDAPSLRNYVKWCRRRLQNMKLAQRDIQEIGDASIGDDPVDAIVNLLLRQGWQPPSHIPVCERLVDDSDSDG